MEMKISMVILTLAALVVAKSNRNHKNWWKHGLFYHIYVQSYMDSNGDGFGDLQGIIKQLQHLKNIGVTAAWLSPIYKSPQIDAGYDISDYKAIQKEYGTMEDFEKLMLKAKELDIKMIMDLVPNHTSDQHEWFAKSVNREPGYEDYYIWADGPDDEGKTPPNNWNSVFKYSAWEWSKIRKQWFLHQFTIQQPDLNLYNPQVFEEFEEIMRFWLAKGVYGFRIDAVPHLTETGMEDEPPSGDPNAAEHDWEYFEHVYTKDQPDSLKIVYQFRDFIDKYNSGHPEDDERIILTEGYANITITMKYYGDGDKQGAHFPFNFKLVPIDGNSTAQDVVDTINLWMDHMPKQYVANWLIGNHDNARVATKMGRKNVDGFNMLISILPGIAVTYQGEEIGLENGEVSWKQGQDPAACNGLPEDFPRKSRDFERTPFHWSSKKNAGFSTADETWLPVSKTYLKNNLELQIGNKKSHYELYRQAMVLRLQFKALMYGGVHAEAIGINVIVVLRRVKKETIVFLFNMGNGDELVDLKATHEDLRDEMRVLMTNSGRIEDSKLNTRNLILQPHECIIAIII